MTPTKDQCWWQVCDESREKECSQTSLSHHHVFLRWMADKLAPVLLGAKTAELLCFRLTAEEQLRHLSSITALLDQSDKVGYRTFETVNGRYRVLFYHFESLQNMVDDHRNQRFLLQRGYVVNDTLEKLLDQLVDNMENGTLPHEIGLFLGYPLKDVMGFIGHPSLKLTKVTGWRVYGDPEPSDRRYRLIQEARRQMRLQMERLDPRGVIQAAC
ncbi:DUF3793 family protein [Anoxynatronum buryatiense]|uniref:DUF3793 family protein n=1 Tax=Anoxynatronum buryatiense TaxID=489973 RepID=A0AA45WY12_9CLOT|nr:DUF3793 family protein [Anoxynatronum buryatiense]SMP61482.1 Protein of unknown function [Anoxynatronum buryatiense]